MVLVPAGTFTMGCDIAKQRSKANIQKLEVLKAKRQGCQ